MIQHADGKAVRPVPGRKRGPGIRSPDHSNGPAEPEVEHGKPDHRDAAQRPCRPGLGQPPVPSGQPRSELILAAPTTL